MAKDNEIKINRISERVYEFYGLVNGQFIKKQYIGYTEEQAIEKFTNALQEGEI